MDRRMIEFIAGLRAAGVRISIAESEDAFNAAGHMGVSSQTDFRDSLRATLVKDNQDRPVFDQLFPLYFGNEEPPLLNINDELSPEEQAILQQALRALLEQLRRQSEQADQQAQETGRRRWDQPTSQQINNLMQLLQSLLQGQNFSQDTL